MQNTLKTKLPQPKICILGLGGLGSNIAIQLVRLGVTNLRLIDFDRVEASNLNRQHYFPCHLGQYKTQALVEQLQALCPQGHFQSINTKITEANILALLEDCHYICEALDNPETKSLVINKALELPKAPIIVGASGMAGFGSANSMQVKKLGKQLYLCGDFTSDVAQLPLCGPRVILCAAQQALVICQLILGLDPLGTNTIEKGKFTDGR